MKNKNKNVLYFFYPDIEEIRSTMKGTISNPVSVFLL